MVGLACEMEEDFSGCASGIGRSSYCGTVTPKDNLWILSDKDSIKHLFEAAG